MKNWATIVFCVGALGAASSAQAEADFYADAYLAFGGDEIAEVRVETIGGDEEDASVKAGEGFGFSFGARFDLGASNWDGVITYGYKSGGVFAMDGDEASFTRYPFTAMLFYDFGAVQLGAGITQEMNGDIDLDDVGRGSYDVDDARGQIFALDWNASDVVTVGLRYTAIDYELSDDSGVEFDGNNFAITAGIRF